MILSMQKCTIGFNINKNLAISLLYGLFPLLLVFSDAVYSVIRHHQIEASHYQKLAEPFHSAVKIIGQSKFGLKSVEGTGVIIKSLRGHETAILTAAHVLEHDDQFRYYALIKDQKIELKHHQTFLAYLNEAHQKKGLIASDLRLKKSYFGSRFPIKDLRVSENLQHLGVDLAIAFFEHPVPYHLASSIAHSVSYPRSGLKVTAVGFGQTGVGGPLYGFSQSASSASEKRAFETHLKTAFLLKILDFKTNLEIRIPTLVSVFNASNPNLSFPGHINNGDSGGPVFTTNKKTHQQEVIAIIIANLPYIETEIFQNSNQGNHYFLNAVKGIFERGSPLSSFFWQEANIYGSEGYYIDVTNPACKDWIETVFQNEFRSIPLQHSLRAKN